MAGIPMAGKPLEVKGGDGLTSYFEQLAKKIGKGASVRVGFLEGATYPTSQKKALRNSYKRRQRNNIQGPIQGAKGGTTVAEVAAANEFGDPAHKRPPRPFFRNMVAEKSPTWGKSLSNILKLNNLDVDKSMALMGEGIRGQLQESIRTFTTPGLAESTKKAKGFDKPLIDTAHMIQSADYVVIKGTKS